MKAEGDPDSCAECGLCADICPEVFEMADNGKAVTKVDSVPPGAEENYREAADQCPGSAIEIWEEE